MVWNMPKYLTEFRIKAECMKLNFSVAQRDIPVCLQNEIAV